MIKNIREATPEELEAWHNEDYLMKMDFNPLVMFVVIPTIIQLFAVGFMFSVMYMNTFFF